MKYNDFYFECRTNSSVYGRYECLVTRDKNDFRFIFHFDDPTIYDNYDNEWDEEQQQIAIDQLWNKFNDEFRYFVEMSWLELC